jgi:hypothetical protein
MKKRPQPRDGFNYGGGEIPISVRVICRRRRD